jgi:hypothetical protein
MDEDRQELYEDRAEWVDLESDVSREKQTAEIGGFWWKFLSWCEAKAKKERLLVQSQIDQLKTKDKVSKDG